MKHDLVDDKITEQDILNSLDRAISSYKIKDFEQIAKESMSKSKSPRRSSKAKKAIVEVIVEKTTVIKNKSKRTKTTKTKKGKSLRLPSFNIFSTFSSIELPGKKVFSSYKKQLFTAALVMIMLSFVSVSSYVAYAYVAGGNSDIVQKVGNHIILPTGEAPKVYIIQSDKSEIFQNPLFTGIKVGDNVLSYPNAGKVVIYRGSEDKVVNIVSTTQ